MADGAAPQYNGIGTLLELRERVVEWREDHGPETHTGIPVDIRLVEALLAAADRDIMRGPRPHD